jgi:hypothetical protein
MFVAHSMALKVEQDQAFLRHVAHDPAATPFVTLAFDMSTPILVLLRSPSGYLVIAHPRSRCHHGPRPPEIIPQDRADAGNMSWRLSL